MHYLADSLSTIHLKKAFSCVLIPINFALQKDKIGKSLFWNIARFC